MVTVIYCSFEFTRRLLTAGHIGIIAISYFTLSGNNTNTNRIMRTKLKQTAVSKIFPLLFPHCGVAPTSGPSADLRFDSRLSRRVPGHVSQSVTTRGGAVLPARACTAMHHSRGPHQHFAHTMVVVRPTAARARRGRRSCSPRASGADSAALLTFGIPYSIFNLCCFRSLVCMTSTIFLHCLA